MAKLFSQLAYEPRSLTEELFARPEHLTLFVSSKMAGGVYVVERERCAYAVEGTGIARACTGARRKRWALLQREHLSRPRGSSRWPHRDSRR